MTLDVGKDEQQARRKSHELSMTAGVLEVLSSRDFESDCSWIAYANGDTKVTVALSELKPTDSIASWAPTDIASVNHGSRVLALAWSPSSSLAVAGSDNTICVYSNILADDSQHVVMSGHESYINNMCYLAGPQALNGPEQLLASVGDDRTCRLWNTETGEMVHKIRLRSPGVTVKSHQTEPDLLLVAQLNGQMGLYDQRIPGVPALVLCDVEGTKSPTLDADWCPLDNHRIAAVRDTRVLLWDLRRPALPRACTENAHSDGVARIRWSNHDSNIFATTSKNDCLKFFTALRLGSPVDTVHQGTRISGLAWLGDRDACVTTGDRVLTLWKAPKRT